MNALAACSRALSDGIDWWLDRCRRRDALERRRDREQR